MNVQVFLLHIDPESGQFNDEALLAFQAERQVISVAQHMISHDGVPTWAIMLSWREPPRAGAPRRERAQPSVAALDQPLYAALRAWRTDTATQRGKPPYVIATNKQLAAIVSARPLSLSALGAVPGVGQARLDQHGAAILAVVAAHVAQPAEALTRDTTDQ